MSGVGNCYDNATVEAFFSTLKTECFPVNQVFETKLEARREIFEYIEIYYNNQRLHSALGYQSPNKYETEYNRVIDIGIRAVQSGDVVTEDRALRGRNSSADTTLQTAGRAARSGLPGRLACRSKSDAKNPRGSGGQSHPIPLIKH